MAVIPHFNKLIDMIEAIFQKLTINTTRVNGPFLDGIFELEIIIDDKRGNIDSERRVILFVSLFAAFEIKMHLLAKDQRQGLSKVSKRNSFGIIKFKLKHQDKTAVIRKFHAEYSPFLELPTLTGRRKQPTNAAIDPINHPNDDVKDPPNWQKDLRAFIWNKALS
jgi:hypothetical protein